jgi:hypothetical protein
MRLAPAVRRSLALLTATALISSGGAASGLFTGTAFAAGTVTSVNPSFAPNNASGTTGLTFTTDGTVPPGASITLTPFGHPGNAIGNTTPSTVNQAGALSANFDLRAQAPGAYNVTITTAAPGGPFTCTSTLTSSCFTINGGQPTVLDILRKSGAANSPDYFEIDGSAFAAGLAVTFEHGGVIDSALSWTTYVPGPSAATMGPTSGYQDNPTGANPIANRVIGSVTVNRAATVPPVGGTYDVVVTNTDNKTARCVSCFTVPRIDSTNGVYRLDQAPGVAAQVGYNAAGVDLIVKGTGFSAGTKAAFYVSGDITTSKVTINSVTLIDPQTLKLNVTTADQGAAPVPNVVYDLTLTNGDDGYENAVGVLTLKAHPTFAASNGALNIASPGVSSKMITIAVTSTNLQTGATLAISPATGITQTSFVVNSATSATLVLDIAASAPLTARTLTITNPDFGVSTGTATITPTRAPVLSSISPNASGRSVSADTTFTMTLAGNFVRPTMTGTSCPTGTPTAPRCFYRSPAVSFLMPDGTPDTTVTGGTVTYNTTDFLSGTVSVTVKANAAPGPRRVLLTDENFSTVECFTASGGACFTVDTLSVSSVVTTLPPNNSFDTNDHISNLTVAGAGFVSGATVTMTYSGQPDIPGTSVVVAGPGGSLAANFDLREVAPYSATGNRWSVRVTNPSGDTGLCRNCFGVAGGAPRLTSVSPATVRSGQKLVVITVTGAEFARGAVLTTSGTCAPSCAEKVVASRLISRTQYEFTLDTTGASVGPRNLTITNVDGLASPPTDGVGALTVQPGPTATSASPASRGAGSPTVSVTIAGSNFGAPPNAPPAVTFSGAGVSAANVVVAPSGSSLTADVTVAPGSATTVRDFTVTNADGSTALCSGCFTVLAAPTVTAVSPKTLLRGGTPSTITVTGTGFDTAANGVTLDLGPLVTVTGASASSATTLTATVSVDAAAARGFRTVKVTDSLATNGASGTLPTGFGVGNVPTAPVMNAATRGNTRADLVWNAPSDDGGLEAVTYAVTVTPTAGTVTIVGTKAAVTGLTNGTVYTFSVKATNSVGSSPKSNDVTAKPATVPEPPTAPTASAGDGSANVSWTAPTNNGGEPVSGYTVTSSPDAKSCSTGSTACSVLGLANGTAYTFSVVATNLVGNSTASASTAPVTPLGVAPQAVTNLAGSAAAAAGRIDLTWTAPPANTLTPVTQYRVALSPNFGTVTYPANRATTGATVTGLTNGIKFTFTVFAKTTAEGPGASVDATPYDVPGVVGNLNGSRGDQSVTLTWDVPVTNGGNAITGYTATLSPGGITKTVSATTATFTGLANGVDYTASVVATNARGNGPAATAGPFRPAAPPGPPLAPSATAGNASATVSWTAPASNGGTPITGYTVTSSPGAKTCTTATTSCTVSGLTNATSYTFTVTATNAVGTGPASAATAPVTTSATAPVITNLAATPSSAGTPISTVTGVVDDPAATVTIKATDSAGGAVNGTATVNNGNGSFTASLDLSALADGSISVTATATSPASTVGTASTSTTRDGASRYVALTPARLLDTRSGKGAPTGPVVAQGSLALQVTGRGGVPSARVSAVVLNVTVTAPTAAGYLTVFPAGATRPTASNLNFTRGQTVPNLVVVTLGTGGQVSLFNGSSGTTHVLADVAGYFTAGTTTPAGAFGALSPARLLDTRNGTGAPARAVAGAHGVDLQVTGAGGVPSTGVSAVVLNVTVTAPTQTGFLTVFPTGTTRPTVSNLNFVPKQTVPNLVIVPVSATGQVTLYNGSGGTVQLVADVAGYFRDGSTTFGGSFTPVTPARVLDTRNGTGAAAGKVAAAGTVNLQATGAGGVPSTGVSAVVLNVTVTGPVAAGYLTAYPQGTSRPVVSNLNFLPGQTVPNLVLVPVGPTGKVALFNGSNGATHVIADVAGYITS